MLEPADTLRFYANRIHEHKDPHLTLEELDKVLQWPLIPNDLSDVYDYALCASMFMKYLEQIDLERADAKTKSLVSMTLKKLRVSTAEENRYSSLIISVAGIAMANFAHYGTSWWYSWPITTCIIVAMSIYSQSATSSAKDRSALARASKQNNAFFATAIQSTKELLLGACITPVVGAAWRFVKAHLWMSLGIIALNFSLVALCQDPFIRIKLADAQIYSCVHGLAIWNWMRFWPDHAVRYALQQFRLAASLTSIYRDLHSDATRRIEATQGHTKTFEYPAGFDHNTKVRILKIKRQSPFAKVLETELLEVEDSISRTLPYNAISHVWRHDEAADLILVDGCRFLVTPNVHKILRKCASSFGDVLVYLDCICINQSSYAEDERVSQIRKMRSIYEHARLVQVFLVDERASPLAVPFMHELLLMYGESAKDLAGSMETLLIRAKRDRWIRAQVDALLDLLCNPWFKRAWIVQEYVVAREVTIHYGGFTIDWDNFMLLVEMLQDSEVPQAALLLMSAGNKPCLELKSYVQQVVLLDKWRKQVLFERYFKLSAALRSFRGCQSTRWQDKVFAFIGFTEMDDEVGHLIDYSTPKDKLLLDLAKFFLRREGLEQTLPFAGLAILPDGITNLPTWVADWSRPMEFRPIASGKYLNYKASGDMWSYDERDDILGKITISAQVIDRIMAISEVDLELSVDSATLMTDPIRFIDQICAYFISAYQMATMHVGETYQLTNDQSQQTEEAVCRTLFGDATHTVRPASSIYSDLVSRFVDHGTFIVDALEVGGLKMKDVYPLAWGKGPYTGQWQREREIRKLIKELDEVRWLCGGKSGRRFCVTENGLMSMVPKVAKPGDVVVLLPRCPVPIILREVETFKAYQLVGDAFVHGIMDGELAKQDRLQHVTII